MNKNLYSILAGASLLLSSSLGAQAPNPAASDNVYELAPMVITGSPMGRPIYEMAQPWTIIDDNALDDIRTDSLGDTLGWQPGISATHFTAGASRPVIRGQEGKRVQILSNGISNQDLSSTSADHAVTIDPLLIETIEILRGPATLLYGGNAIGGAVNVTDSRIPTEMPEATTGVAVAEYKSVSDAIYTGFKANLPSEKFVFHVDGIYRESDDYDAPDFSPAVGAAKVDTVANSDTELFTGAVGGSYIDERGYAGASFSALDSEYGVLTEGGKAPFIEMDQYRFVLDGEREVDSELIQRIGASYAYADYEHTEFEAPGVVGTGFELDAHELRLELGHHTFGKFDGVIGYQFNYDDKSTPTVESIFAGNNVNQVDNLRHALFILEEYPVQEHLRWEIGGRIDMSDFEVSGNNPTVRDRDFTAYSASTALILDLNEDWVLSGNVAYSERTPSAEELYTNGKHEATESFTYGQDNLDKEESLGFDVSLRRKAGIITGEITGFITQYDNFIYEQATGRQVNEDGVFPVPAGDDPFTERRYVGVEAQFIGFEASAETYLWHEITGHVILRGMADYTRATNESANTDLPRIPPMRVGGELEWEYCCFRSNLEVRHAFEQDNFDTGESKTDSYTLVNLRASYVLSPNYRPLELYASVENLTDELAFLSTSYRKDKAPMPGRSFNVGVKYEF